LTARGKQTRITNGDKQITFYQSQ